VVSLTASNGSVRRLLALLTSSARVASKATKECTALGPNRVPRHEWSRWLLRSVRRWGTVVLGSLLVSTQSKDALSAMSLVKRVKKLAFLEEKASRKNDERVAIFLKAYYRKVRRQPCLAVACESELH